MMLENSFSPGGGLSSIAADVLTEATEAAVSRIAELLRHPDDLTNKFPSIKKKMTQEKRAVDAQLKTAAESQMDDAQKGLEALRTARIETSRIKQNLMNIDKFCADAQTSISNYSKIKHISTTHRNFMATKDMVEQFQQLNSQISRIRALLAADLSDIIGPHNNILFVHYQLFELEAFRTSTLIKAKTSSQDVLYTLQNYFKKIDVLVRDFEDYLWEVARHSLDLAKHNHHAAIVRMVKIIELEEKADDETALMENNSPIETQGIDTQYIKPRQIKSYRIKFFDILREGISRNFKELFDSRPNKKDPTSLLQNVDAIIDDLIVVYDELMPCFPEKYNIFQFFVLEYHRFIYGMTNDIVSRQMEGGDILSLLKWVREYYESMNHRLGVGEELLEPKLLDGREEELMQAYVKLVRSKLNEWLTNLLDTETKDFIKRDSPPDEDASGMYILSGSVIVFQMFNQQLDVAAASSRGPLLYQVVVECVNILIEFQNNWIKVMDAEFKKFDTKSHDLAEGLPEYIMALANDCFRSTEFSETMSKRLESMLDQPWLGQATTKVKEGADGFMKVAKKAYNVLIDFALSDCKRAMLLFHCQQWYEQDLMKMVIATFEDYCGDYKAHLTDYLFGKLTLELMDKFVVMYIESFRNKNAKFKMPFAAEKMKLDLAMASDFFATHRPVKKVKATLNDLIEKIISLIESNHEIAFLDFYALWKNYPDIPLSFVEEILTKRDDLTKAQIKEVMESCQQKVKEDPREITTPSPFGKLATKK